MASRLVHTTGSPISDSVSLRLRAFKALNLAAHTNSRTHSSTGTLSPSEDGSNRCVGVWFQGLLTPVLPVLFIVRSRYYSLSVAEEYLALEGGPPRFTPGFPCPVLLGIPPDYCHRSTGLSPSMAGLSRPFARLSLSLCGPTTPAPPKWNRFRLFRVRSPLLAESRLISFPVGTEMCHFPTFAVPPPMDSVRAGSG